MKLRIRGWFKTLATVPILYSLFFMTTDTVMAQVNFLGVLPDTGEKPSNVPYILMGVMALCLVVIVLLFLPKKKEQGKKENPTEEQDTIQ